MQSIKARTQEGKKIFANNLIKFRQNHKLSQRDLAKLVGVKQQYISAYENMNNFPKAENLEKIAEVLNTPVRKLLGIDTATKAKLTNTKSNITKTNSANAHLVTSFKKNINGDNTAINRNFKQLAHDRRTTTGIVLNKLGLKHIDIYNTDKAKPIKYLIYTSQYLDTSLDKLAGRDDGFTMRPGLYANIRRVAGTKGIMINQIEHAYNMPLGTLRTIDQKKCIKVLLKLADFFRISLDTLVNGKVDQSNNLNNSPVIDPAVKAQLDKIDNRTELGDKIAETIHNHSFSVPALLATINSNEDEFHKLSHDENIQLLVKIANQLSVSVDSLINNDVAVKSEQNKFGESNQKKLNIAKAELESISTKVMSAKAELDNLYRENNQAKIDAKKVRTHSYDELHEIEDKIEQAKVTYQELLDKNKQISLDYQNSLDKAKSVENNQFNQTQSRSQVNNAQMDETPIGRLFKQAESLTANQILTVQSLITEFVNLNSNK